MVAKKAFLVGITDYQLNPPLRGCDLDAGRMRKMLRDVYGYDIPKHRILRNEEATKDAILNGVDAFVTEVLETKAKAIFYYSGHGLARYLNGRTESAMLPHDWCNSAAMAIYSSDFAKVVGRLNGAGIHFVGIFDTCDSGAMGPFAFPTGKQRSDFGTPKQPIAAPVLTPQQLSLLRPFFQPFDGAVSLTACDLNEYAWEVKHSPYGSGGYGGAYTYALIELLSKSPRMTFRTLTTKARRLLKPHQTPQLLPTVKPAQAGRIPLDLH